MQELTGCDISSTIRHAVRVLLIDASDRVLLFASLDDDARRFWYTPGGGQEYGETAEETARRELREETGLCDVNLDPEIWHHRLFVSWGGVTYDVRERWFVARIAESTVWSEEYFMTGFRKHR